MRYDSNSYRVIGNKKNALSKCYNSKYMRYLMLLYANKCRNKFKFSLNLLLYKGYELLFNELLKRAEK